MTSETVDPAPASPVALLFAAVLLDVFGAALVAFSTTGSGLGVIALIGWVVSAIGSAFTFVVLVAIGVSLGLQFYAVRGALPSRTGAPHS